MAALFDLDLAAGIHHWQDVAVLECSLGKTSQYIQLATAEAVRWMRTIWSEISVNRSEKS